MSASVPAENKDLDTKYGSISRVVFHKLKGDRGLPVGTEESVDDRVACLNPVGGWVNPPN